jgi:hypothetical protein
VALHDVVRGIRQSQPSYGEILQELLILVVRVRLPARGDARQNQQTDENELGEPRRLRVSLIVAASQQTETAESSAREEYPKRIEPRPKHEHDRGDRHRGGLPIGVSRARHHGAAGDDEPNGDRN